ncbi:GGDEF domain-containing protein [Vibrio kyushuensis]|uniref:GGDEF domain-containing protein n=1 Tax=Vibrio kyushuensis TaxID=2910249 RepID=UPI003D11C09D
MKDRFDLFNSIPAPIILFDPKTKRSVFLNECSLQLFELSNSKQEPSDSVLIGKLKNMLSQYVEGEESTHQFTLEIAQARCRMLYEFTFNYCSITNLIVAHGQEVTQLKKSQQLLRSSSTMLEKYSHEMHVLAHVDQLTNIPNRRSLFAKFNEMKQANNELNCAVSIIDIDHFKRCNDTYGHCFGDDVLKAFATHIHQHLTDSQFFARLGGEEFCIIHNGADSLTHLKELEFILLTVRALPLTTPSGTLTTVSFSAGVADSIDSVDSLDELLRKADKALYYAKQNGRSQIIRYSKSIPLDSEYQVKHGSSERQNTY